MKRWEQRSALPSEQARWRVGVRPARHDDLLGPSAVGRLGRSPLEPPHFLNPTAAKKCNRYVAQPSPPAVRPWLALGPPTPPTCYPYAAPRGSENKCRQEWAKYHADKHVYDMWEAYAEEKALADVTDAMLKLFYTWRDMAYFEWLVWPKDEAPPSLHKSEVFKSINQAIGKWYAGPPESIPNTKTPIATNRLVAIVNNTPALKSLLSNVYNTQAWRWIKEPSQRLVWGQWFGDINTWYGGAGCPSCFSSSVESFMSSSSQHFHPPTIPFLFGLNNNSILTSATLKEGPGKGINLQNCPKVPRSELDLYVFKWPTVNADYGYDPMIEIFADACWFKSLPPMGEAHQKLAAKPAAWDKMYKGLVTQENSKWESDDKSPLNCSAWKNSP